LVDIEWVEEFFPSLSSYTTSSINLTIALPSIPVDHMMFIAEVEARAPIVVSIPSGVLLTTGTQPATPLATGKTGFWGFRYSANAGAWFLLSSTAQV
jgi:hypothetical protein